MLHSGSRGIGNVIGRYFINLARKDMERHTAQLPHRDLAYFPEGAKHFDDYVEAVHWAQDYAIRAGEGELGIIPGSMGAKSYIVRGLGNPDSFCSCSHGAGRKMSRAAAKHRFNQDDMEIQTQGVECRKDTGVIDEIPGAYKSIDEVMENQNDLVEVVQVCVKG